MTTGAQGHYGRENISPKAIGLLSSHFDGFPSLKIEEIHAGSRCGILTGSRSGTLMVQRLGRVPAFRQGQERGVFLARRSLPSNYLA